MQLSENSRLALISILNGIWITATLGILFLFLFYGSAGAKLGIPLPFNLQSNGANELKLFVTEIYLLLLILLGFFRLRTLWSSNLIWIISLFITLGLLRMIPDLGTSPYLVIRHSAFIWYLSIPLLVCCVPISSRTMISTLKFFLLVVTLVYLVSIATSLVADFPRPKVEFLPEFGNYILVIAGFFSVHRSHWLVSLALMGLGLGLSYYGRFQRTFLVSMVLILIFAFYYHRRQLKNYFSRMAFLFLFILLGAGIGYLKFGPPTLNAFVKSELVSSTKPLERFRWYMWEDAAQLFLSHPFIGIGFLRPVVHRVYLGGGNFVPNTGGFEHPGSPPISGPHNSYLNALARIGLLGGFLLVLHLYFLRLAIQNGNIWIISALFGPMVYAMFNVGLEGPTRSLLLLIAMGVVLKLRLEQDQETFKTS